MATITTITYNGIATALAVTATSSLAASNIAGAESIAADNTANKYVDAMVAYKLIYGATVPAGHVLNGITVSTDNTNYGSPATGADAALTLKQAPLFPNNYTPGPGGSLLLPTSSIYHAMLTDLTGWATTPTVFIECSSVAACLGCPNVLPLHWGWFTMNRTSAAFGASNTLTYTGITYTNT